MFVSSLVSFRNCYLKIPTWNLTVRAVNFDKIFFVPGVWREFTNILECDVGLTGVDDPEMRA